MIGGLSLKKRSLALLMVLMMLITLVTPTAFAENSNNLAKYREKYLSLEKGKYSAQSNGPIVSIGGWPSVVTRGDEFWVEISIGNVNDLYGASIDIKYDPTILEVVEYEPGKPVNDSWNVFMENGTDGIDIAEYVNEYDKDDSSIIHYSVGRIGNVPGFDVDWGTLGSIRFRVKDDAVIPSGIQFKVSDLIDDLDNGNANVIVKLSDSNAQSIVYDSYGNSVYIYDIEDANGEIKLDWSVTSELDLDAHLLVTEDVYNSYEVYFGNRGILHDFPKAILLNDDSSGQWNNFTASEKMLYNELIPGSEFAVNLCGDGDLSSIEGDITVTLDVYSIDNYSDPITFNIKDAEGSGVWWHVFEVMDDNNDGVVEIVPINEINNVDLWGNTVGGYYDPYIEITSDNFWGNSDTQDIIVTGNVIDMVDGYNTLEVEINGTTSIVTINADGSFSVPLTLQPGANFVTLKYIYGDNNYTSQSTIIYYDTFYVSNTPTYDYSNNRYSGNLELRVYDSKPINADFDTQTQIYGELYRVNQSVNTLEYISDLTFDLNEDKYKYTTVTDGITFGPHERFIIKFYSDTAKQNLIGIGKFGVYPTAIFKDLPNVVNSATLTVNGFLAFADQGYDSLKIYVNENPWENPNSTGIEITNVDSNGNFSVDVTLQPGENHLELELKYDYGNMSGTSGRGTSVYYDASSQNTIAPPTIIPLDQQSDSIWHDGILTTSELDSISGEYPAVFLEFKLPDGVGTGDRDSNTGERTGYWKHVMIYDQNNNYIYGTMSPIQQGEVDTGIANKSIPVDGFRELTPGETYLLYAQIENVDNGSMSELSLPVVFTYEDDSTQLSSDATLSDLTIDGTTINGFIPQTTEYNVVLPVGTTTIPTVDAIPNDSKATVDITQATSLPGLAKVTVTAEDGTVMVYTINFSIEEINTIKIDNAIGVINSEIEIPISIESTGVITGVQFDLAYDPNVVQIVGFTESELANLSGSYEVDNQVGFARFVYYSSDGTPINNNCILGNVKFNIVGNVDDYTVLDLKNINIGNSSEELNFIDQDGEITVVNVKYGDVNNDTTINVFDILQIVDYILGRSDFDNTQILAADVNGDSTVNVFDILQIVDYILGRISTFPVEN